MARQTVIVESRIVVANEFARDYCLHNSLVVKEGLGRFSTRSHKTGAKAPRKEA